MIDTGLRMQKKWTEISMQKTPEQRFLMGCSMFDMSKEIVVSSLHHQNQIKPTKLDIRQQLFLRFYADQFNRNQTQKILAHLSKPL